MTYESILAKAREVLSPRCKVCPVCNGKACAGLAPGPGGKGSGMTFQRNYDYLYNHVKLHLDVLGEALAPDTSLALWGMDFTAPVFAAPIGMVARNWSPALNEGSYAQIIIEGTQRAGTIAFTGGGPTDDCFYEPLAVIKKSDGYGIPTLKPWNLDLVEERLALVEQAGAPAFAMDIDSAGLPHAAGSVNAVSAKSQADLKRIVNMTELPFLVKGIMTASAAVQAAEAQAYGIVVSNHGGRVLDQGLSTAEVLPEIRRAVGGALKIFVDGGVRTGVDVFKMLALGADAVLIGRPYSVAAYGGGAEGVQIYTEKIIQELKDTMKMTNCRSLQDIREEKIRLV